jgi:hypothetical protein
VVSYPYSHVSESEKIAWAGSKIHVHNQYPEDRDDSRCTFEWVSKSSTDIKVHPKTRMQISQSGRRLVIAKDESSKACIGQVAKPLCKEEKGMSRLSSASLTHGEVEKVRFDLSHEVREGPGKWRWPSERPYWFERSAFVSGVPPANQIADSVQWLLEH